VKDTAIAQLLARQDGVATVAQLLALGATYKVIRAKTDRGEWVRAARHVVGAASAAHTWRRDLRVAWLEAGSQTAVSHSSAARLHGFDGFDRAKDLHLTACAGRHRTSSPDVTIHRSLVLREKACTTVDGMRVVSKPIALVQVAELCGLEPAEQALDGILRDGAAPLWIEGVLREWQRPGSPAGAVLSMLHDRVGRRLPRSWFQRVARRILVSRGVELVDEQPVEDPETGKLLAELDLAHVELRIGVECQSWEWHGSPAAQAADARRKRRLRVLGWEIVDVWWSDLRRIDEVVAEIQYLIDQRIPRLLRGGVSGR
jgi:hypothetical protein